MENFSTAPVTTMHVDINSCFATIEQQANPRLRGRPIVVAAYVEPHGCILAASREAKQIGIQTGMRVGEAKVICSHLAVLPPDPDKYRFVNRQLKMLLDSYAPDVIVESIDEMVLKLSAESCELLGIAKEIKQRIRKEIGEWITVSIGIAPNRYLAKVAADQQKPDGLVTISADTIEHIFSSLKLTDLCGIKDGISTRLQVYGIRTPMDLLCASPKDLARAMRSITGYQWWMRLHGYEDGVRYKAFGSGNGPQKSFGQSYALGAPKSPDDPGLWQVLTQLVMKMGKRLREDGYTAAGIGVSLLFADHTHWGVQHKGGQHITTDADFYGRFRKLLAIAPQKPVRILAIDSFHLSANLYAQQLLFDSDRKQETLTKAVDAIWDRYGPFTVSSGRMLGAQQKVLDRIAFGKASISARAV